jgi:glycosyltransferase involved in cell wall biosynthesis
VSAVPRQTAPAVSVVVPVHDEAGNVAPLHAELCRVLDALPGGCEILFVDDGSRDATAERLAEIVSRDPRVKVVRFRANRGQALALQAGFDVAGGEIVVTLDGDLQNDPADIPRLLDGIAEGYDVVCGWRRERRDPFWSRRLPSAAANRLIAALTGVALHDNGCTLRAYRREALRRTAIYGELHRFLVPLLVRAGCRHREVVVRHRPRASGRSKYGVSRLWRVLLDLLTVRMLLGFAARPAVWFGWMSAPFAAAAAAALAASAWFYSAPRGAGPFPVVLPSTAILCACAALQLVALGLLAELVVKVGDLRASELPSVRRPGAAAP